MNASQAAKWAIENGQQRFAFMGTEGNRTAAVIVVMQVDVVAGSASLEAVTFSSGAISGQKETQILGKGADGLASALQVVLSDLSAEARSNNTWQATPTESKARVKELLEMWRQGSAVDRSSGGNGLIIAGIAAVAALLFWKSKK